MRRYLPIAIIFLLLLATGFLVYVNLFPEKVLSILSPSTVIEQAKQPLLESRVDVASDVAGVSVEFVDRPLLLAYLDEFNFWQEGAIGMYGETRWVTVKKLTIRLSEINQPYEPFLDDNGQVYQSMGERFNSGNGELELLIYIAPFLIEDQPRETVEAIFENAALTYLYTISHPFPRTQTEERKVAITQILQKHKASGKKIFAVAKRRVLSPARVFSALLGAVVKKAYAQCSGTYKCLVDQNVLVCSSTGQASDCWGLWAGAGCGPAWNRGTCQLQIVCQGDGGFKTCVGNQQTCTNPPQSIGCCGASNSTCSWGGGGGDGGGDGDGDGDGGGGFCDSGCGTCGFRLGDGSCTTDNSCCRRVCSGSNCITVFGGGANDCDNNAQCCAVTSPDAPTLVSPEHGETITTDSVTLNWNAISNWGNQCGNGTGNDVYQVYMDTSSSPSTQRCVVSSGSPTNCPVSGLSDQTTYYWKVRADSGVATADSTTRAFTVNLNAEAWWQVRDSDLQAEGNLVSTIPPQCVLPDCDPTFDLDGTGGYPGVCAYGGASASFGAGSVSSKGWLANSAYAGGRYDYAYFSRLSPPKAQMTKIEDSDLDPDGALPGGYFVSNSAVDKVNWFYREGDLTLKGTTNMNVKRAVVLVEGNLNLGTGGGSVNLRVKDGVGFLGFFVQGNIAISPQTRTDDPDEPWALEALLMADGSISTGTFASTADYQLTARGSWVAWGGISLQRDLDPGGTTGANNTTPAELFEYAPDLLFTFPRELARRGVVWREIAP